MNTNLIFDKLKLLKPLFKGKGNLNEVYALIKDGVLYYNNGVIKVTTPIDIPFETGVHLYQFHLLLNDKQNSIIVKDTDGVWVRRSEFDLKYMVSTTPIETLQNYVPFNTIEPRYSCNKPQVFLEMCNIGQNYVQTIENPEDVKYAWETLLIHNNFASCSDKKNAFQGWLDFPMPNMALTLDVLVYFCKIAKGSEIVAFDTLDNELVVRFDNGLTVYLPMLIPASDKLAYFENLMNGIFAKRWANGNPDIEIPHLVKEQLTLINKLTLQNVVYLTNSFCESERQTINFPTFGDKPIRFKCLFSNFKTLFKYADKIATDDNSLYFVNSTQSIRGVIGKIISET